MLTPILEEVDVCITLILYHHPLNAWTEQQITLYLHGDGNNLWRVLDATVDGYEQYDYEYKLIMWIEHGTRTKLRDVMTDEAMHSHEVRPLVSDVGFQDEVSAYGMTGFASDINDDWIAEIEKGESGDKASSIDCNIATNSLQAEPLIVASHDMLVTPTSCSFLSLPPPHRPIRSHT
jgi:dolichyl-phosphate-mannose--protein O-mannosyl transferase